MLTFFLGKRWSLLYRILVSSFYILTILAFSSRWTKIAARGLVLPPSPITKSISRLASTCSRSSRSTERTGVFQCDETTTSTSTAASSLSSSSSSSSIPELYEEEIRKFLAPATSRTTTTTTTAGGDSLLDKFHIQGWRWHTKSLVRDAGRLHRLALKTGVTTTTNDNVTTSNAETLKDASDYVVGFNLVGLHKIEETLFFPWMREKLTSVPKNTNLSSAFSHVMDKLENDRRTVANLGNIISRNALIACDTTQPESDRSHAINEVADRSAQLQNYAQGMMNIEENLLVPAISLVVPEREQKSFNNKVLLKLGLLDSRLHLVGMYEAICVGEQDDDDNNDTISKEKELFQQAIPSISRRMIPRWKRKLYQPKTYMLE